MAGTEQNSGTVDYELQQIGRDGIIANIRDDQGNGFSVTSLYTPSGRPAVNVVADCAGEDPVHAGVLLGTGPVAAVMNYLRSGSNIVPTDLDNLTAEAVAAANAGDVDMGAVIDAFKDEADRAGAVRRANDQAQELHFQNGGEGDLESELDYSAENISFDGSFQYEGESPLAHLCEHSQVLDRLR